MEAPEFDFTLNLETVEFWRGEYAKRKFYCDHKDDYARVTELVACFKEIAKACYEEETGEFDEAEARLFEKKILDKVDQGKSLEEVWPETAASIEKNTSFPDEINEIVKSIYELSVECGYVVCDLVLFNDPVSCKERLVAQVQFNERDYWGKVHQDAVEHGHSPDFCVGVEGEKWFGTVDEIRFENEVWCARAFGQNASPWHKVKTFDQEVDQCVYSSIQKKYSGIDLVFGVKDILSEDLEISEVLNKVEKKILSARFVYLISTMWKLASEVKEFAKRSSDMENVLKRFDYASFQRWHKKRFASSDFGSLTKTILDFYKDDGTICGRSFLKKDEKKVARLVSKHEKTSIVANELFEKISVNEKVRGPVKKTQSEMPRAYGLYLWDTVYIDGKSRNEAVEELREFVGNGGYGLTPIGDGSRTPKRHLKVTERCVKGGMFLSMGDDWSPFRME